MLETVLMVVDFIVCVALIGAVLLQTGRGAGLSSSFGSAPEHPWVSDLRNKQDQR